MASSITNPIMALSCSEPDAEMCDLGDWTTDIDLLTEAFASQGDGVLSVRGTSPMSDDGKLTNWGSYLLISQGGEPDELVVDWNANKVTDEIHTAWMAEVCK